MTLESPDYDKTAQVFTELQEDVQNRILKKGYTRAGMYFKTQLESTIKNSDVDVTSVGRMNYAKGLWASGKSYSDNLLDAVTGKFHKGKGFDPSLFKVSMMGVGKAGSGTFRLRFFEDGTVPRYQTRISKTGKKYQFFVGAIPPKHFMQNTVASATSMTNQIAADTIVQEIQKYEKKLNE